MDTTTFIIIIIGGLLFISGIMVVNKISKISNSIRKKLKIKS